MKREKLANALNEINEEYIAEALQSKKRSPWRWVSAVAALLAVAITALVVFKPLAGEPAQLAYHPTAPAITTPEQLPPRPTPPEQTGSWPLTAFVPAQQLSCQVAIPVLPQLALFPYSQDGHIDNQDAYNAWLASRQAQYDQPAGYTDSLIPFITQSIPTLLIGAEQENRVCSPANIYMALAMLAETSDGQTRQEILTLLGADSIESLRTQAGYVWNANYKNDGASTCLLSNSIWLDEKYRFNQATADLLAKDYYASVFHGDLGSDEMNRALQTWLNENTGGLLKEQASGVELDDRTPMALASTIYYSAKWEASFWATNTAPDIFHTPGGDVTVPFMHTAYPHGRCYYGEDFTATTLSLQDGSKMWLILPNEGYTPEDILTSGHAMSAVLSPEECKKTTATINLSMPKFDVTGDMELSSALKTLGIRQAFGTDADYSPILPGSDIFLSRVNHAARVKVDEEGVEAAAYTVMVFAATGMIPEDELDFTLDKPFVFIITGSEDLPLFAGIVNNP